MHFHQNHCWCPSSHWDSQPFYASYMVDIDRYASYDLTVAHHKQLISNDWLAMVDDTMVVDQSRYDINVKRFGPDSSAKLTKQKLYDMSMISCPTPKPEVIKWLQDNVLPEPAKRMNDNGHGWAMGDENYRILTEHGHLVFWFYRRNDAMKFIREWSVYSQPTTYFNYFKDDRRKLIDGRLTKVDQL